MSDCLGRRLGPRLLGRADDSGVRFIFSYTVTVIFRLIRPVLLFSSFQNFFVKNDLFGYLS